MISGAFLFVRAWFPQVEILSPNCDQYMAWLAGWLACWLADWIEGLVGIPHIRRSGGGGRIPFRFRFFFHSWGTCVRAGCDVQDSQVLLQSILAVDKTKQASLATKEN